MANSLPQSSQARKKPSHSPSVCGQRRKQGWKHARYPLSYILQRICTVHDRGIKTLPRHRQPFTCLCFSSDCWYKMASLTGHSFHHKLRLRIINSIGFIYTLPQTADSNTQTYTVGIQGNQLRKHPPPTKTKQTKQQQQQQQQQKPDPEPAEYYAARSLHFVR